MEDADDEAILQHVRGATVAHESPFSTIVVPCEYDSLSQEQIDKWVIPFYRVSLTSVDDKFLMGLKDIYDEIDSSIIGKLLADFNWRPRLTGAFFAAIKRLDVFEEQIGKLLLRSDLCFAGSFYCIALATFNSEKGSDYLKSYLEYYLSRPELDYDQGSAMGAIFYLDSINQTNILERFKPMWDKYTETKKWAPELNASLNHFVREMEILSDLREKVTNRGEKRGQATF